MRLDLRLIYQHFILQRIDERTVPVLGIYALYSKVNVHMLRLHEGNYRGYSKWQHRVEHIRHNAFGTALICTCMMPKVNFEAQLIAVIA